MRTGPACFSKKNPELLPEVVLKNAKTHKVGIRTACKNHTGLEWDTKLPTTHHPKSSMKLSDRRLRIKYYFEKIYFFIICWIFSGEGCAALHLSTTCWATASGISVTFFQQPIMFCHLPVEVVLLVHP